MIIRMHDLRTIIQEALDRVSDEEMAAIFHDDRKKRQLDWEKDENRLAYAERSIQHFREKHKNKKNAAGMYLKRDVERAVNPMVADLAKEIKKVDPQMVQIVKAIADAGLQPNYSCEGGPGHDYPWPYVAVMCEKNDVSIVERIAASFDKHFGCDHRIVVKSQKYKNWPEAVVVEVDYPPSGLNDADLELLKKIRPDPGTHKQRREKWSATEKAADKNVARNEWLLNMLRSHRAKNS